MHAQTPLTHAQTLFRRAWTLLRHASDKSKIDILKTLPTDFFVDTGVEYVTLPYFFSKA